MAKYARFDPKAPQPAPVLGWYDADLLRYGRVPADSALAKMSEPDRAAALAGFVKLTDAEWKGRLKGRWAIATSVGDQAGSLVPVPAAPAGAKGGVAPAGAGPPTATRIAADAVGAGIEVVSASSPGVSGTYPMDRESVAELAELAAYATAYGALPGGLETYPLRDAGGTYRYASATAVKGLARAAMDRAAQVAAVAASGRGAVPSGPVQIP